MNSYKNISVKEAMDKIRTNEYVLPAIQRELVWKHTRIEELFDSLLSGYPLGSMLFWRYNKTEDKDTYKFYEFISYYDEFKDNKNKEFSILGKKEVIGVLDGQQRLTSFLIGLYGHLNIHKTGKQWGKSDNYDKKYLYLNLLYKSISDNENEDDTINKFEIKFKKEEDIKEDNKSNSQKYLWYKVGNILECEKLSDYEKQIENYNAFSKEDKDTILFNIKALYSSIVEKEIINYYEVEEQSFDTVLNIFVRVNSGGVTLSSIDLLFSIIVNQWGNGRDEINEKLKNINIDNNFDMSKDIFLRGCLYLIDAPLEFKVDNFKQENIKKIQDNFEDIVKYISASCGIFRKLGYNKDNLKYQLIVFPLAQFLMQNKIDKIEGDNLKKVKQWIQLSILSGVFSGGSARSYLNKLRDIIRNKSDFPIDEIIQQSKSSGNSIEISQERLEYLIENAQYGNQETWTLLTLLYSSYDYTYKSYDVDHIFPKDSKKMTKEQYKNGGNYIVNLQLLEPGENREEKRTRDPEEWLEDYCKRKNIVEKNIYKEDNFIPIDYEMTWDNFDKFINDRKCKILQCLASKLGIKLSIEKSLSE